MFLGLGLKLLGIKDILLKNWKIVLVGIIIASSYFYVKHLIRESYNNGVKYEYKRWQEKIDIENIANRESEKNLQNIVDKFGTKVANDTAIRVAKEQKHIDKVNTIIKENTIYSECVVDKEIIDARNEIRTLGPKL